MPLEGSATTTGQTLTSGNPLQQPRRLLMTNPSGPSRLARLLSLRIMIDGHLPRQNDSSAFLNTLDARETPQGYSPLRRTALPTLCVSTSTCLRSSN